MLVHRAHPSSRSLVAGSVVTALAGISVLAGALPAGAATPTIDPFAASSGFTVVATGDVVLGNGELEGSVASLGTLSSRRDDYPLVHAVSGSGDYSVPVIDGVPVRLLAQSIGGAGMLDIANRNAPAGTGSEQASMKLADTTGLAVAPQSGGTAGTMTRVTAPAGAVVDLEAVPYTDDALARIATASGDVSHYIDESRFADAASQLTATYDTDAVHVVALGDDGAMLHPTGFATDRPNVLDYASLVAGGRARTVKTDGFGGYQPSPQAPLIIRVPAGTTLLRGIDVEGWDATRGAQQNLASSILYDLSAVTGQIAVDGVDLGSVFAPFADVVFESAVSANGQWVTRSLTTSGGAELHHATFRGIIPTPGEPTSTTVPNDPEPTSTTVPNDPEPASTVPMSTLTPSTTPMRELTPSKMPWSTLTPSKMPWSTLTPSTMPMRELTPSEMPWSTLTPSTMPWSALTPSTMPMRELTPSKMPMSTLTPSTMPWSTLTPSMTPMREVTPSITPPSDPTPTPTPTATQTPVATPQQVRSDGTAASAISASSTRTLAITGGSAPDVLVIVAVALVLLGAAATALYSPKSAASVTAREDDSA